MRFLVLSFFIIASVSTSACDSSLAIKDPTPNDDVSDATRIHAKSAKSGASSSLKTAVLSSKAEKSSAKAADKEARAQPIGMRGNGLSGLGKGGKNTDQMLKLGHVDSGEAGRGGEKTGIREALELGLSGSGRGGGGIGRGGAGYGRIGGLGNRRVSRGVPNSESYKNYGVNGRTLTRNDKFSTFSIDVDTGAYTITRKKLMAGILPPKDSVRVEEFVNYFTYDYASPKNSAFSVQFEGAPSPFSADKNQYIMRIGVQGKRVATKHRKPVHLTFLVDVSGSMRNQDKLPLVQRTLRELVNNLQSGDTVAITTYAGRTTELLSPTDILDSRGKILEAIEALQTGGGTGMSSGMESAYRSALKSFVRNHVNRVIVLSDGDANIGPHTHEEILKRIKSHAEEGITLTSVGFGTGNYKDTMMEQLADKGNGNYYYVDSEKEARKIFGSQIGGTFEVIAKDVKIQVEFNPKKVRSYRLIGYENRDIADEDFRNDKVDAGEIGAGHSVTALYELELKEGADGKLADVRIRAKKPNGHVASELRFPFFKRDIRNTYSNASQDFQFQLAVAAFAEILRKSKYADEISPSLIEELAKPAVMNREERKEFLTLVRKTVGL